jgi:hypothetical protein
VPYNIAIVPYNIVILYHIMRKVLQYSILPHPPGCPTHHGHTVVATEVPPTIPHHPPVVPARPPLPSVDCRVIRPARYRRCTACCPAAPCRHHAARRSHCAFCRPCRPSKLIVESSGPLVAVVVPHVALTSAATRHPPLLVADC